MSQQINVPDGMRAVVRKNPLPVYAIGVVWLVYSLLFPLYKPFHFILAAAAGAAAYFILDKLLPEKTVFVPDPTMTALTGQEEADQALSLIRQNLTEVRRACEPIDDQPMLTLVARIDMTCQRILSYLMKNPGAGSRLRRFSSYYMPTLLKLTRAYGDMERAGVEGENISQSKKKILQTLELMDKAFEKQLDALFDGAALDISAEADALETILKSEGLGDGLEPPKAAGTEDNGGGPPPIDLKF